MTTKVAKKKRKVAKKKKAKKKKPSVKSCVVDWDKMKFKRYGKGCVFPAKHNQECELAVLQVEEWGQPAEVAKRKKKNAKRRKKAKAAGHDDMFFPHASPRTAEIYKECPVPGCSTWTQNSKGGFWCSSCRTTWIKADYIWRSFDYKHTILIERGVEAAVGAIQPLCGGCGKRTEAVDGVLNEHENKVGEPCIASGEYAYKFRGFEDATALLWNIKSLLTAAVERPVKSKKSVAKMRKRVEDFLYDNDPTEKTEEV